MGYATLAMATLSFGWAAGTASRETDYRTPKRVALVGSMLTMASLHAWNHGEPGPRRAHWSRRRTFSTMAAATSASLLLAMSTGQYALVRNGESDDMATAMLGFTAAGMAAATAVMLWRSAPPREQSASFAGPEGLQVAPVVGPDSMTLMATGRFR